MLVNRVIGERKLEIPADRPRCHSAVCINAHSKVPRGYRPVMTTTALDPVSCLRIVLCYTSRLDVKVYNVLSNFMGCSDLRCSIVYVTL